MKKIKKNYLQIIVFISIIAIGIYYLFFVYKPNEIDAVSFNNYLKESGTCYEENKDTDFCQEYLKYGKVTNNQTVLDIFFNLVEYSPLGYLNFLASFIIGLVALKNVSKILNSRIAKYYLIRENYKDFIKLIFKSVLKYVCFLPVIFLILYIVCGFLGKWQMYGVYGFDENIAVFGSKTIIVFLFNVVLMSTIYLLVSLITLRITSNYYIGIILNYLIYFILAIFFEIYLRDLILYGYFSLETYTYLLFFNVFNLRDIPNLYIYFGIRILVILVLFMVVALMYKDKEKFVKYIDKNEVLRWN